jgi:dethiobiotin synthetase
VLVADAGLGTINAVRLSVDALGAHPTVVYLNRFDPGCDLHSRNLAWLTGRAGLRVLTGMDELSALVARAVGCTA